MRDDLVVPGEHEENFVLAKDARVVTVPFTPLEQRMAKEKPYLMEGLAKLKESLGEDSFKRLISNVHNINLSGPRIMLVADNELHLLISNANACLLSQKHSTLLIFV